MLSAWNPSWPHFYAYLLNMIWNMIFFLIDLIDICTSYVCFLDQSRAEFCIEIKVSQKKKEKLIWMTQKSFPISYFQKSKTKLWVICVCQICNQESIFCNFKSQSHFILSLTIIWITQKVSKILISSQISGKQSNLWLPNMNPLEV